MQPKKKLQSDTFGDVVSRRMFLKGALAAAPVLVVGASILPNASSALAQKAAKAETNAFAPSNTSLTFEPISLDTTDTVTVPANYRSQTLIRWGDPMFGNAPAFDLNNQNRATQEMQFGFNCDFVCYFPLDTNIGDEAKGNSVSRRGLLAVNHEYTNPELMFPNYSPATVTAAQIDADLAAHGASVVEIVKNQTTNDWSVVTNSSYNRRITGFTPMELTGPAAGDVMLQTSNDPSGRNVLGMLNNCGGGWTPWGTILTCEENFNQYFGNLAGIPTTDPRRAIHARYGMPTGTSERRWESLYTRFNMGTEPNEPFRYGYVVEIDPYNPNFVPKKHTALGRFKHEAATCYRTADNRAVVYMGDDERFDYVYKFVSTNQISATRTENFNLLETGTLYAAKYNDDGTGVWIPLVAGQGPLANWTQARISYNTRGAADLVGATRMDRPEDVERNPVNGKIYAAFTNNTQRGTSGRPGTDKANPRAVNRFGHIIEMTETNNDGASLTFTWEIFMLCGNPRVAGHQTYFKGVFRETAKQVCSPLACPDNISFDNRGNLWIATDGMPNNLPGNDGIFAVVTDGFGTGVVKQFLSGVIGAEVAGLFVSQDDENLFVTIQHPGEGSTLANPSSRFPDGGSSFPRPSVICVTKTNGTPIIGS